jgi:hypothetical protein
LILADGMPRGDTPHDPADPLGLAPGAPAFVMPDGQIPERIVGTLVAANRERVVIAREDPRVRRVDLHFPRAG